MRPLATRAAGLLLWLTAGALYLLAVYVLLPALLLLLWLVFGQRDDKHTHPAEALAAWLRAFPGQ